jgi:hypothetical protein
MLPKKPVPDVVRDGTRFSDKIMLKRKIWIRCPPIRNAIWHVDCIAAGMTEEHYMALLLWTICVLMFACSVVAITQHPEWFGA